MQREVSKRRLELELLERIIISKSHSLKVRLKFIVKKLVEL